jgi:hypothetical protein
MRRTNYRDAGIKTYLQAVAGYLPPEQEGYKLIASYWTSFWLALFVRWRGVFSVFLTASSKDVGGNTMAYLGSPQG